MKLQEQYGDDVQVLFVECQNTPKDVYEAFAWKMKWMGNGAMWTTERPLSTTGSGLPETAVLGIDGSVLLQGHPGDFGKKLEETIAAEIKKSKQAPAGTPKELEKAWSAFGKGDLAAAIAECDKLASDASKAAKDEFVARTTAKIERAKRMIESGDVVAADALAAKLEKSTKGAVDLATKVAELKTKLASPELAAERDADKAFASFTNDVAKKKPFEPGNVKRAESLAKKHEGTKNGKRFERFVALAKIDLNK
ncbi:MAG: hypothetical protein IPJ77_24195 [Planctomycetes bacterium]|nr:hypothetical protein [Planctomycetota bacterium]